MSTYIVVLFGAIGSNVVCMFIQEECTWGIVLDNDIFYLGALNKIKNKNSVRTNLNELWIVDNGNETVTHTIMLCRQYNNNRTTWVWITVIILIIV